MKDTEKTREQLITELEELRRQVAELGTSQIARKQTEEALQESERRYRSLFEQTNDAVFILDLDGKHLEVNQRAADMLGYTPDELVGMCPEHVVAPAEYSKSVNVLEMLKAEQKLPPYERIFRKKGGVEFPVEINVELVRDEIGKPLHILSIVRDITKRKRAEEALHKLSHAVEQSANIVVITDTEGDIEYVNPKFTQITGYTAEEVAGRNPRILKSGLTPPETYDELWKTIAAGGEWRGEFLNKKKNGDLYWESASIAPVTNPQGVITHFMAIKEDITARRQAEEALQKAHERLSVLRRVDIELTQQLDVSYVLTRAMDAALRLSTADAGFIGMTEGDKVRMVQSIGLYAQELADSCLTGKDGITARVIRQRQAELVTDVSTDPDYVAAIPETRAQMTLPLISQERFIGILNLETRRPKAFTSEVFDYLKLLAARIAVAVDNARMYEAEQHYREIIEETSDGVYTVDLESNFTYANLATHKLVGCAEGELIGTNCTDLTPASCKERLKSFYQQQIEGRARETSYEFPIVTKGGEEKWVSQTVTAIVENDKAVELQGIVRDITARKRAEEERKQLIVELDAFAHSVAHDLKNPLSAIIGFGELMEIGLGKLPEEEQQYYLRLIIQSGYKMKEIINSLLLLSGVRKLGEVAIRPLDMAEVITEAQMRLVLMLEEHQVELTLPDTWPVALGYAPWVEEVWANYLSNALKYGAADDEPLRIELGATAEDGDMIRFWVRDSGPGIAPEKQARLFIPFTRLAQVHVEGHGLGLSIVHRIIKRLNGQVGVESQVGQGSIFSFTLPAAKSETT